jgi:uncharacterized protein YjeT (DUF2065 family)
MAIAANAASFPEGQFLLVLEMILFVLLPVYAEAMAPVVMANSCPINDLRLFGPSQLLLC